MIYIDTSISLAHLLDEGRAPPDDIWSEKLVSSQLLEYEIWTRLHAYKASRRQLENAAGMLGGISLIDMQPTTLMRIREPFPVNLRALDAIHFATLHYLVQRRAPITLASFDKRMNEAAIAMGFDLYEL